MHSSRRALPGLLVLPALLAFSLVGEEPAFAPESGSTLTKTYDTEMELVLDDLSIIVEGQDVGSMMGAIDLTVALKQAVEFTDTYGTISDGRPLTLERTFERLENESEFEVGSQMGGDSSSTSLESELADRTVKFTWNEEEGEYDVAFPEEEGNEELLDGLVEDTDLRCFLPGEEVEAGATWSVDIEGLIDVFLPGGNLAWKGEESEDVDLGRFEDLFAERFDDLMNELMAGECTCTYKGTRDADGVTLADIEIDLEISSAVDISEILLDVFEAIAEESGEEMPDIDIEAADLGLDFTATGVLQWNLEAGLPFALEFGGDLEVTFDLAASAEMDGEGGSGEVSLALSGNVTQSLETAN